MLQKISKNIILVIAIIISLWIVYNTLASKKINDADALVDQALDYNLDGQYKKAVDILTPLAEKGISRAQLYMAVAYYHGNGVNKNYAKAKEIFFHLQDKQYETKIVATYLNLLGMMEQ